jgi:membrane-bound metal-dependent hydrolase YbcI (DUF457 family)
MPLPLAHTLVGASLAEALLPWRTPRRNIKVALIACLALLPDCDFLLVWVFGLAHDWHRGFSHSMAFALSFGVLLTALWGRHRLREVAVCTLVLMSHGLLDTLTTIDGRGVELFWPFSSARLKAEVFAPTELGLPTDNVEQVLTYLLSITLIEAAILVPGFVAVLVVRRLWLKPCRPE